MSLAKKVTFPIRNDQWPTCDIFTNLVDLFLIFYYYMKCWNKYFVNRIFICLTDYDLQIKKYVWCLGLWTPLLETCYNQPPSLPTPASRPKPEQAEAQASTPQDQTAQQRPGISGPPRCEHHRAPIIEADQVSHLLTCLGSLGEALPRRPSWTCVPCGNKVCQRKLAEVICSN